MNSLEQQAIDKEREKETHKRAVVSLYRQGKLNDRMIELVIDKVFILGHNAGHCRGEKYSREKITRHG